MSVIAASPQAKSQVDYDALAKQAGGVDYDALAAQSGGAEDTPPSVVGTPDESFHGVKEFGRDLGAAAKGFWNTVTHTPTAEDDQRSGESHTAERILDLTGILGASAGLRAVRGYVEGTQDSIEKARQSHDEGDTAGEVFHTAAAALPVVGQMTEGVYDKAKSGDTSGAIGTGLSRALQIGSLGADEPGITGRVTSAPARMTGRLVAKGAGLAKDAAVGGAGLAKDAAIGAYQGATRESGVVARPVNAVIEGATAVGRRISPTPNLERMTRTPVGEKFAPVDVKADAASEPNPIDMSAGEISGHPTLQRIQQVGERSLTGGEPVRERIDGAQRAIAARVDNMKEGYAPSEKVPDTESAGLAVQKQTQTSMQKLKASAQAKFDKWLTKAGDIDVDMGDINDKYSTKKDQMDEALKGMPSTYAAPIRQLLERAGKMGVKELTPEELEMHKMADQIKAQVAPGRLQEVLKAEGLDQLPELQPGSVKMSSAQMLRSAYSDIANNFTGNVPTQVQHLAGELYHDIDGAMESSAKNYSQATGKRGIMKGYRDANAEWSQMQTLYNTSGEPLYRTLKATDGQKVMNQLLEPGTSGGSPKNIRVLRDQGIDLGPVQREVLERIHNKNFGIYGKTKLGGYSDPFLRELFGPVGLEELHMLGKQARAVNYNVNPSGTAGVMSATHDVTDIAKAGGQMMKGGLPWYLENPFIKYGAAKLSNNPAFNDWMTNTKGAEVEPGGRTFRPGKGPGAMLAPDSKLAMDLLEGPKTKDPKAMYHITGKDNVESIRQHGILPASHTGISPSFDASGMDVDSEWDPDSVYAVKKPESLGDTLNIKNQLGEVSDDDYYKQGVVSFRPKGKVRLDPEMQLDPGDPSIDSYKTGKVPPENIKATYDYNPRKSAWGPEALEKVIPRTVPGNNPTASDIAALKAKHGIPDVPSEKVGASTPSLRDALGTTDIQEAQFRKSWLQDQLAKNGLTLNDMVMPHGEYGFKLTTTDKSGTIPDMDVDRQGWQDHVKENIETAKHVKNNTDTKGTGGALNAVDDAGSATANRKKKDIRSRKVN